MLSVRLYTGVALSSYSTLGTEFFALFRFLRFPLLKVYLAKRRSGIDHRPVTCVFLAAWCGAPLTFGEVHRDRTSIKAPAKTMRASALLLLAHAALTPALQLSARPCLREVAFARTQSQHFVMAGFGAAPKAAGKGGKKGKKAASKSTMSPKQQWDNLKEHRKSGIESVGVYARVRGDEEWLAVGEATAKDADMNSVVQAQKRIILEHAVRVHPIFAPKARELECGFGAAADSIVALDKSEAAEPRRCGFQGKADPSGRYGKTEADINAASLGSSVQQVSKDNAGGPGEANRDSKGRV